MPSTMQQKPIN